MKVFKKGAYALITSALCMLIATTPLCSAVAATSAYYTTSGGSAFDIKQNYLPFKVGGKVILELGGVQVMNKSYDFKVNDNMIVTGAVDANTVSANKSISVGNVALDANTLLLLTNFAKLNCTGKQLIAKNSPTSFACVDMPKDMAAAASCTPNTTKACTISNGTGTQKCDANGNYYACQATACERGYKLNQATNTCDQIICKSDEVLNVDNVCTPKIPFSDTTGSGYKYRSYGNPNLYYLTIVYEKCSHAFKLVTDANTHLPVCELNKCYPGMTAWDGQCFQKIKVCSDAVGVGTQEFNTSDFNGGGYFSCQYTNCKQANYVARNGNCVPK